MDKKLEKRIRKALKLRRQELFAELELVAEVEKLFTPRPKIKAVPAAEQAEQRILAAASDRWQSATELQRKAGVSPLAFLDAVIGSTLQRREIGGITHYRKPPLVIVAGEGIRDVA